MVVSKKGDCGREPRVGKVGDVKPFGGLGRGRGGNGKGLGRGPVGRGRKR